MATNVNIKYNVDTSDLLKAQAILGDSREALLKLLKSNQDLNKSVHSLGKETEKGFRGVKNSVESVDRSVKQQTKSFLDLKNTINGVKNLIISAFAVQKIVQLGKEVLNTTAEFQKLQAVLKNTLGSESAAQLAFKQIEEFASKTPFQVSEITESYVKLANRGIIPTQKELTSLGDIAASQGKSFNQLTEAILDATTGEFERLKEFGIRAKQSGDQVSFTFKGVTTTVAKTDQAIKDYIISLGSLQGVSGSMEAQSKTLGGQLSNLDDAIDRLFFNIGNGTQGPLKVFIDGLIRATNAAAEFIKILTSDPGEDLALDKAAESFEKFKKLDMESQRKAINELAVDFQNAQRSLEHYQEVQRSLGGGIREFAAYMKANNLTFSEAKQLQKEVAEEHLPFLEYRVKRFRKELELFTAEFKKNNDELKKPVEEGILKKLQDELKATQEIREASVSEGEIRNANVRIALIQDEIKRLTDLGTKREKINAERIESKGLEIEEAKPKINTELDQRIREQAELLKSDDLYKKELEKREEEHQEKLKELRQQAASASIEIGNALLEIQANKTNEQLSLLQRQKEEELKVAGDNQQARARIEESFAKKEAELKKKQAKREKAFSIFNILINTAQAISKSIALSPLTFGLPFSAIAAAVGAAQVAAVQSKPIPAFAKGTDNAPGGLALVGEEGPELAIIPRGTKIKTANETKSILGKVKDEVLTGASKATTNVNIDYEKLGNVIGDRIERIPINNVNIDETGFSKYVDRRGSRTKYYNSRYKAA